MNPFVWFLFLLVVVVGVGWGGGCGLVEGSPPPRAMSVEDLHVHSRMRELIDLAQASAHSAPSRNHLAVDASSPMVPAVRSGWSQHGVVPGTCRERPPDDAGTTLSSQAYPTSMPPQRSNSPWAQDDSESEEEPPAKMWALRSRRAPWQAHHQIFLAASEELYTMAGMARAVVSILRCFTYRDERWMYTSGETTILSNTCTRWAMTLQIAKHELLWTDGRVVHDLR